VPAPPSQEKMSLPQGILLRKRLRWLRVAGPLDTHSLVGFWWGVAPELRRCVRNVCDLSWIHRVQGRSARRAVAQRRFASLGYGGTVGIFNPASRWVMTRRGTNGSARGSALPAIDSKSSAAL
jgi:hypothetical protein